MECTNNLIIGIENPLLDIQIDIDTLDLLHKYELTHGQACLAVDKHQPLFAEIWASDKKVVVPGGSSLNSIRAANHMLKNVHPGKCAFIGSIGNDEVGRVLQDELRNTGIEGAFHIDPETPTGSCAVIIH